MQTRDDSVASAGDACKRSLALSTRLGAKKGSMHCDVVADIDMVGVSLRISHFFFRACVVCRYTFVAVQWLYWLRFSSQNQVHDA